MLVTPLVFYLEESELGNCLIFHSTGFYFFAVNWCLFLGLIFLKLFGLGPSKKQFGLKGYC